MRDDAVERDLAFVHAERADMKWGVSPFNIEKGGVLGAQSAGEFAWHERRLKGEGREAGS